MICLVSINQGGFGFVPLKRKVTSEMICNMLSGMILYISCVLQYDSIVLWEHSANTMMQALVAAHGEHMLLMLWGILIRQ